MFDVGCVEKEERDGIKFLIENTQGTVINKTLNNATSEEISLFAFQKIRGLQVSATLHDSTAYMLDGSAQVSMKDEVKHIGSGGLIFLPSNIPSSFKGDDYFEMLLVMNKGRH